MSSARSASPGRSCGCPGRCWPGRRFTAQVGLGPKRFARVQRLQRVVRDLDGCSAVDWAGVAARYGYADQSHLVAEFGQLAGVTPTEYLRSRIDGPNHLSVVPTA